MQTNNYFFENLRCIPLLFKKRIDEITGGRNIDSTNSKIVSTAPLLFSSLSEYFHTV